MPFPNLAALAGPLPIDSLDQPTLRELQIGLSRLGYPIGAIDGEIGPKTRNAWAEFKTDAFPGKTELIGPESVELLATKVASLNAIEASDQSTKAQLLDAIRAECQALDLGLKTQISYVQATTQWETNQTFQPVREAYWHDEAWRQANFRYYPYYGRGYVQPPGKTITNFTGTSSA